MDRIDLMLEAMADCMPGVPSGRCKNRLSKHYVYTISDECGNILYVGMTNNIKRRIAQHRNGSSFFTSGCVIDVEDAPTRRSALNAEAEKIKTLSPKFNKMHK